MDIIGSWDGHNKLSRSVWDIVRSGDGHNRFSSLGEARQVQVVRLCRE